jgi:hypothetical protein
VKVVKCVGSLAAGIALLKYSVGEMQPLWSQLTPTQRASWKIFIPGVLSMAPAGRWFGSDEGPAEPRKWIAAMVAWMCVCFYNAYKKALRARIGQ